MELKGLRALTARLKGMEARAVKTDVVAIGFLEGSSYPDGTPTATIAAIQEFGSGRIPSRPFFRNMISAKSPAWGSSMAAILAGNGYDAEKTLGLMGIHVAAQLQQSILDLVDPPLAPATVARKGFDKPLVDSSHMLNSVASEVVPE